MSDETISPGILIAGHYLKETIGGRVCDCGMRWSYLLSATRDCINQPGWAHTGTLTEHEFSQIHDAKEALWATLNTK